MLLPSPDIARRSPPCRQSDESLQDCVSRKIPEIKRENPDMADDQVQAIAYSMCRKRCEDREVAPEEGDYSTVVRTARDPQQLASRMSDVQRRVWDAGRTRAQDVSAWRKVLDENNRVTALDTLQKLVSMAGCGGPGARLGDKLQAAIGEAANASAGSIANTFDFDLAAAILAIGKQTPTANYRTYRSRLFGDTPNSIYAGMRNWAARHGLDKVAQIYTTETGSTINLITELFYKRNPGLEGPAELVPYAAECEICQAGVNANPYPSVQAVYDAGPWPAHVGCVHTVRTQGAVLAKDCREVWKGE